MEIVKVGDPVLRRPARPVAIEEITSPAVQRLIDEMFETVNGIGVGLAAPQVGVDLQIAVIEDPAELQRAIPPEVLISRQREPIEPSVVINPTLTVESGEPIEFFEGCLSVPGYQAIVPRARTVTVSAWDRYGRPCRYSARGWHARILQHEVDHLLGRIYLDRMLPWSFVHQDAYVEKWRFCEIDEVRNAFGMP